MKKSLALLQRVPTIWHQPSKEYPTTIRIQKVVNNVSVASLQVIFEGGEIIKHRKI